MTGLIVWPWHVCKFPSQTPLFGCEFWDLLCPKKVGSLLLRACPLPRASLIDFSRLEMHLNHFSGRWSANQQIEESLPNVFFSNFPSNWNKSARTIIAWITLEKWPRLLLHPYSCRLGRAGRSWPAPGKVQLFILGEILKSGKLKKHLMESCRRFRRFKNWEVPWFHPCC